tara:strand:- start:2847 stop:3032 length:186 start_codon:yes stop_codon:yes gene_type:complete
MLKYQITGDMIRAKMDELLEERRILLPTVMIEVRKALYEEARNLLKEEMEKQKAEDKAKEL